jgi:hypothetical protein
LKKKKYVQKTSVKKSRIERSKEAKKIVSQISASLKLVKLVKLVNFNSVLQFYRLMIRINNGIWSFYHPNPFKASFIEELAVIKTVLSFGGEFEYFRHYVVDLSWGLCEISVRYSRKVKIDSYSQHINGMEFKFLGLGKPQQDLLENKWKDIVANQRILDVPDVPEHYTYACVCGGVIYRSRGDLLKHIRVSPHTDLQILAVVNMYRDELLLCHMYSKPFALNGIRRHVPTCVCIVIYNAAVNALLLQKLPQECVDMIITAIS